MIKKLIALASPLVCLLLLASGAVYGRNRIPISFEAGRFNGSGACQFVAHLADAGVCISGNRVTIAVAQGNGQGFSADVRFAGGRSGISWEALDPGGNTAYFGGAYQTNQSAPVCGVTRS